MIDLKDIKLYRELRELNKKLFEEKNREKALEIAEKIDNLIGKIDNKFKRWYLKQSVLKHLLGFEFKYPSLIPSITNTVDVIYFLYNILNIEIDSIVEIIKKWPYILRLSTGYMEEKVNYLKSIGIKDIKNVVKKLPQAFGYDIVYIDEKVEFLKNLGFKLEEIVRYIEINPAILAYSAKRFISRIEYARLKGYKIKSLSDVSSLVYPSDEKFIEKLKRLGYKVSLEEYLAFKESIESGNIDRKIELN
ncbi:MAG: hypothetical protein QXP34_02540 [Candidatus Aenigmatarchaeota archaeon]